MTPKPQQNYYDEYWNRDAEATWTPEIRPMEKHEFAAKMARFKGSERVLDVGCGDATTYAKQLMAIVGELHGLDVSARAADRASKVGLKATQVKFDSEPFPYDEGFFDGATCIEVFEHLFDPLFTAREIFRVLKPGGTLVTSVPNFGYFGDRIEALLRARLRTSPFDPKNHFAGAHIRFFGLREFRRLLKAAGFEEVELLPHGSCSVFDALWFVGPLVPLTCQLKERVPYLLRLGFLEWIWPSLCAQHLMLVVRKPQSAA